MPFKKSEFTELGRYTDCLLDLIDAKGVWNFNLEVYWDPIADWKEYWDDLNEPHFKLFS